MPSTEDFHIDTLNAPSGARIFRLIGPLTLQSLFHFQEQVRLENTKSIILDLTSVAYMDSAGLGSVIGAFVSCQRTERGFAIAGTSDRVNTLFMVAHVNGVLPCFNSLEAAENSLKPASARAASPAS